METLDWMVNVNLFDNETGSFWKGPGKDPSKIKTEVFMLPCAASFEKEGSLSNSGRWMQWRYKAVNPPGQALPDLEIIHELFLKVRKLYKEKGGAFPEPILNLSWNYGPKGPDGIIKHPDPHYVAKEINGYTAKDIEVEDPKTKVKTVVAKAGEQLGSFAFLQDDGSTTCGNWLYCGSYTEGGNMAARRGKADPTGIGLYPGWAWCWPVNRRIIYNRASVNWEGKPWNPKRAVIWWDGTKWQGDVPDGPPPPGAIYPFIMLPEGHARLFGLGMAEGPFPEHYEPLECPIEKNLMSSQKFNPTAKIFGEAGVGAGADKYLSCDPQVPPRLHHLPGDRTLADGGHDPLDAVAHRTGTPDVRGDVQGAGQREGNRERRARHREIGPGRTLGQSDRDRPVQTVQDRGADRAPGRHSLALRLGHARGRRGQRQPAHPHHRGRQHHDSGIQGLHGER